MPADLLIPVRSFRRTRGTFALPDKAVLTTPRSVDALPLKQLAADLRRSGTRSRVICGAAGPATIRLRRDPKVAGRDAYRVDITRDGIDVAASADPGAYYAVQTLRELLRIHGRKLPLGTIADRPDFPRRGVYLDCSRGKVPTLDTLKTLVERLAAWKINEFQVYVENVFTFAKHPAIGRGYSPFTPAEMIDLQDHCRSHHIALVGSLASFGHMERILCLPEYSRLGEMAGFRDLPGGTTLCPGDPGSVRLMEDLYDEFLPLHEAEDFNVCCDETWELGKGRSRRRAGRVGVGRVYLDFLLKLHRLCEKHGKRMNAWADIVLEHPELLGELPQDIVMLNWEYGATGRRIPRTREITDAGLPCVVCPGTSGWQSHGTRMTNAIGNVAGFAAEGRRRRVEGLLNTDWGDGGHRNFLGVSLHGYAHGTAHAWNGRAVDDAKFTRAFCFHAFGRRDGGLARAIRTLGDTYLRTPGKLYHGLVESLTGDREFRRSISIGSPVRWLHGSAIDDMQPAGLRKIVSALADLRFDGGGEKLHRFEALALRELAASARMDALAARRALTAKDIRAGKTPATSVLRGLANETRRVAGEFEKLWLARNRPSRLKDNLTLFRKAEQQCRKIAK